MPLLDDFAASQYTKGERWRKLYRVIHHLFLKDEFIHIDDYKKMVNDMNNRIKDLEQKVNTELRNIQSGLSSHFHQAPQAPSGILPTKPPEAPPYTATTISTNEVIVDNSKMLKKDNELMLQGPAKAPLADRSGAQEQLANATIQSDINSSTIPT